MWRNVKFVMEFLSLFLKEHDSDADIGPYFLLTLVVMLGDPGVNPWPPFSAFRKSLHGRGAGGKNQPPSAKATLALSETPALSLLCLETGDENPAGL